MGELGSMKTSVGPAKTLAVTSEVEVWAMVLRLPHLAR
jgi:hypothetical protein